MEYTFGHYRYVGDGTLKGAKPGQTYNSVDDYKFDENYYNKLLQNRQFETALAYRDNFQYVDLDRQQQFLKERNNFALNIAKEKAIYDKAKGTEYYDGLEFYEAIQSPGGVGELRNRLNEKGATNYYLDDLKDLIHKAGGTDATHLEVTFFSPNQSLFGIKSVLSPRNAIGNIADALVKDNVNTIDNFYSTTGLTPEELRSYGVEIIEDDGDTKLRFSKDNDMAVKILYGTYKSTKGTSYQPFIDSYVRDENGELKKTFNTKSNTFRRYELGGLRPYLDAVSQGAWGNIADAILNPSTMINPSELANNANRFRQNTELNTIPGLINRFSSDRHYVGTPIGHGVTEQWYDSRSDLAEIGRLIDDAKADNDEVMNSFEGDMNVSTIRGGEMFDELQMLKSQFIRGELTPNEYYKMRSEFMESILTLVKGMGSADLEIYSNAYNDKLTDETIVPLDNEHRSLILNYLSGVDDKRIRFVSGIVHDKVGTWIEIDRPEGKNALEDFKDNLLGNEDARRVHIFVPGLFTEEAQNKINNDTSTRAAQQVEAFTKWGYEYTNNAGSKLKYDANVGTYYKDGIAITKNDALRDVEKDMIVNDAIIGLQYKYKNAYGDIIDTDAYLEDAKRIAIASINSIDDTALTKIVNGEEVPLTPDEIFVKAFEKSNTEFTDDELNFLNDNYLSYNNVDYIRNTNFRVNRKLKDILEIYDELVWSIRNQGKNK